MKIKHLHLISLLLLSAGFILSCSQDDDLDDKAGTLVFKLADAASDHEEIKGIFLTISDVKLNGKPIRKFEPQTVEVSALRNGKTKLLVDKQLPAKQYGQVSLVLCASSPHTADVPGCYVLTKDNIKHNLFPDEAAEIEVVVSESFELLPGKERKLIADFDLRKSVIRSELGKSKYHFVTPDELEKAVRIVDEENTGKIYGTVKANFTANDEIYLLIYNKGEFKAADEGTGRGKSKILFSKAVTSTKVEPDESYQLPYLEEGEYDIRLAAFRKNKKGEITFYGFLPTTSRRTGMLLNNIEVTAGAEVEINIEEFRLF